MNFAADILNSSRSYPDRIAYRDGNEDLTYRDLIDRVLGIAETLSSYPSRSVVIICMEDCVDWPCAFLACLYTGLIPFPVSTNVSQELLSSLIDFTHCKLIIGSDDLQTRYPVLHRKSLNRRAHITVPPVDLHPDDIGYLGMSSGSTGFPKIAVHRHAVFAEIAGIVPLHAYDMTSSSIVFSVAKMSWGYGLHNSVTYPLSIGATAVVMPDLPLPANIVGYIEKYRPNIVISSPSVMRRFFKQQYKSLTLADSVCHWHSSGEDLPEQLRQAWLERFGLLPHTSIGMLETCQTYAATTKYNHCPGTVGSPLPGVRVRIVGEDQQDCLPGRSGEIYVDSPANAMYYLKNYQATRDRFVGCWVRTGDCGYWDDNGNLVFTGRTDDIFKVNDLIVSPVEVENEILKNQNIEQAAVVGIPNTHGQRESHAFLVVTDDFSLDDFRRSLSIRLLPHQVPKFITIVEQLPETLTNKQDRKTLAVKS